MQKLFSYTRISTWLVFQDARECKKLENWISTSHSIRETSCSCQITFLIQAEITLYSLLFCCCAHCSLPYLTNMEYKKNCFFFKKTFQTPLEHVRASLNWTLLLLSIHFFLLKCSTIASLFTPTRRRVVKSWNSTIRARRPEWNRKKSDDERRVIDVLCCCCVVCFGDHEVKFPSSFRFHFSWAESFLLCAWHIVVVVAVAEKSSNGERWN